MSKLVRVTPRPNFPAKYLCCRCRGWTPDRETRYPSAEERRRTGDYSSQTVFLPVWCDPAGPAFAAYYCPACAAEIDPSTKEHNHDPR